MYLEVRESKTDKKYTFSTVNVSFPAFLPVCGTLHETSWNLYDYIEHLTFVLALNFFNPVTRLVVKKP